VFCPLQSEPRDRRGLDRRVSLDDLRTLVRPLLERAYEVELTGFGEIFCHPDLVAALRFFKELGLTVNATSNGLLWTRALLETILRERLIDLLCISVDAGTAPTYERLRAGGDWPALLTRLEWFRDRRAAHAHFGPVLHFSFITTRDNLPELPEVVRLAQRFGAAAVIVQGLFENLTTRGQSTAFTDDEQVIFAEAARTAAACGVQLEFWYQSQAHVPPRDAVRHVQVTAAPATGQSLVRDCRYPWERVFVKSNLDVQACATVWEKLVMGNLRRQSFESIWRGPAYRDLRAQLAGPHPPEACLICHTKPARAPIAVNDLPAAIDFGDATHRQMGQGFYLAEDDGRGRRGRWTHQSATFYLPNAHRPFLEVELVAHPQMPPTSMTLTVNGHVTDRFSTDELIEFPTRFALPPFEGDLLEVQLHVDRLTSPIELRDSESRRPLGLWVYRAALIGEVSDVAEMALCRGFYPHDPNLPLSWRWTSARAALVVPDGLEVALRLQTVPGMPARELILLDNGEEAARLRLPTRGGVHTWRVPLPRPAPWHVLTMLCTEAWRAPGDTRSLGVLFGGARVKPRRRGRR
jgi:MoaA/NifB/PqqE/SkfB family radical SAM enzyme